MSRKGENIYKRKDGRWEARYIISHDEKGHARYKSVYDKSYTGVKKKRQEALLKLSGMDYKDQPKAGTVESVSNEWIRDCAHKWKESTKCRYREKLDIYVIPHFGKRELSDISTAEVESFISLIQTKGMPGREPVSAGTARSVLTVLKQIRLHALKMDHQVRFNPECIIVRSQRADITVFSENEEKRLVAELSSDTDETDAGLLTCLFTGIRVGELCALNCDNIDLEEGVIRIRATMQRLPDHSGGKKKTKVTIDKPKSECSMRYYAVFDTNVLISSLLTRKTDTATAKVVDAIAEQKIIPLSMYAFPATPGVLVNGSDLLLILHFLLLFADGFYAFL